MEQDSFIRMSLVSSLMKLLGLPLLFLGGMATGVHSTGIHEHLSREVVNVDGSTVLVFINISLVRWSMLMGLQ